MRNRGNEYNWKLEANMAYEKQEDEYLLPHSIKSSENISIHLGGKKNFIVGDKMHQRLLLDLHATYQKNLDGAYRYGGSHPEYISVTGLETTDANYLNSDHHHIGASLTYSQRAKAETNAHFFVKATYGYTGTSDFEFDKRKHFSISAGYNF
jgi:hypothetical protein